MIRRISRALRLSSFLLAPLENRRLLSGIAVAGNAADLFDVAGPFTSVTAAPVGSDGNSLVQFLDGTSGGGPVTLREAIISANMSVVTGPTTVNLGGLALNPFGKLASVTDSNGNIAVLLPGVSSSFTTIWNLARFDPSGTLLGTPTLVGDANTGSAPLPAMAAGPNGEIGIVIGAAATSSSNPSLVFGQVFDANDNPLTSQMQLSAAPPATGSSLLLGLSATFDPQHNEFFAAEVTQSLSTTFQSTGETLATCTFNDSGVAGTPHVVDQELSTSLSDNAIRLCQVWASNNTVPTLLYGVDLYQPTDSTGVNFNFIGTSLRDQPLDASGLTVGAPIIIDAVSGSTQFIPFPGGVVQGPTGVTVLGVTGVGTGGGILASGVQAVTFNPTTGVILTNNNPVFTSGAFGTIDPAVSVTSPVSNGSYIGFYYHQSVTTNGITTSEISGQPLIYSAPTVAATPSISVSTGSKTVVGGVTMQPFNIDLNQTSNTTVTVRFSTVALTGIDSAHAGADFTPVNQLVTFAPGQTHQTVNVSERTVELAGLGYFYEGMLTDPTAAIIAVGEVDASVTGPMVTFTGSAQVTTHGTVAPGQIISGSITIQSSAASSVAPSGTFEVNLNGETILQVKGNFGKKHRTSKFTWKGPLPASAPVGNDTLTVDFVPDAASTAATSYLPAFSGAAGPITLSVQDIVQKGLPFTVGNYTATLTGVGQAVFTHRQDGSYDIALSGTNAKTKLAIAAIKGLANTTVIHDITDGAPLGTLSAPGVSPTGNLALNGVGNVLTGDIKDNHLITLGTLANAVLQFGAVAGTTLTATGSIKSLTVNSWTAGSVTADTITKLKSTGNFDADLHATTVGTLLIGGTLGGTSTSDLRTLLATTFGSVTVGAIQFANLFAGVDTDVTTLPTARADFANATSKIGAFTLAGPAPAFTSAAIAAPLMGIVNLGSVTPTGTADGITAESLALYTRSSIKASKVTTPTVIDTLSPFLVQTV